MEDYKIDAHKLMYHPGKVADWLEGKVVYPINAEVGLSGACNHRCTFCCIDYMGYIPDFLSKEIVMKRMDEMHRLDLKSVVFAGNGEPLLHRDFSEIVNYTKMIGIDAALSTNGVLFTEDIAKECMNSISWIRFSISAGTEDTYYKIHRGKIGDLNKVFTNISTAAYLKKKMSMRTVLGVQIVMTPENESEVILLAKKVKELGADQFSVKSLGWNPMSGSDLRYAIDRKEYYLYRNDMIRELDSLCDDNFRAIYRGNRVSKAVETRRYHECFASPFHVCIEANGNVVPCCSFQGDPAMSFGNIYRNTFDEIWSGEERKRVLRFLKEKQLSQCPAECRLSDMNEYLYELRNPGGHVNFI